jgi:hypothetical protein
MDMGIERNAGFPSIWTSACACTSLIVYKCVSSPEVYIG